MATNLKRSYFYFTGWNWDYYFSRSQFVMA